MALGEQASDHYGTVPQWFVIRNSTKISDIPVEDIAIAERGGRDPADGGR